MMAAKFELWFGCLGNGTTVCNKAVTENGDYKKIAHISEGGKHPAICCRVLHPSRSNGKNQSDGK